MVNPVSAKSLARTVLFIIPLCLHPAEAVSESLPGLANPPIYSPSVNGEALRGLNTVGSAETMGADRFTFDLMVPWYTQKKDYPSTPGEGAQIYTLTGAFSYGVNDNIDLFGSLSGFGISSNKNNPYTSGLGTIRAGVQGSLPFPRQSLLHMGAQASIIGGTARSQINTHRFDGYNYLETRVDYDVQGRLMQTFSLGDEVRGLKLHVNEGGILSLDNSQPLMLQLGAGLQGNMGPVVIGAEINSRTRFTRMLFDTDPLWFTPSLRLRTPYQTNIMVGMDIALSKERLGAPRALEPWRLVGAVAFSFDVLAEKKRAEDLRIRQEEAEREALAKQAAENEKAIRALARKKSEDSALAAQEMERARMQMDSLQRETEEKLRASQEAADALAKKVSADSLALVQARKELAREKEARSDAEKMLLSTGELLLDAVYFSSGKTTISRNSKPYLNVIGKMLAKYPKLHIEVAGHTDNIGSQSANLALSQGRADAVRHYLIEISPSLAASLSSRGYGMNLPKANNSTKEGRETNRRVELRVINRDALEQYNR